MLRILHAIETPGTGGAERVLVDVARSLSSSFQSLGLGLVDGWTMRQLRLHGIATTVLPLNRAFDVSWPLRFARFLERSRIDVVHCHEFTTSCYAALGCALASVPLIATVHGQNYWPERAYRRAALRWVISRASAVVTVSEDSRRHMSATLGVDGTGIGVVANGVDLDTFQPDAVPRTLARRQYGAHPDDIVIICLAALEVVKAHDLLFDATAAVRAQLPSVKLWLAGDGCLRESLERRSAALGLTDTIRFFGWQTDVRPLIAAADLSVLASHSEGMPLAILESMASSRAVIATRVGGIGEIVEDGVSGLLVAPNSATELADAVLRLARDRELRDRLARTAAQQAREKFSLATTVERYEQLYRRAADRHRSRSARLFTVTRGAAFSG